MFSMEQEADEAKIGTCLLRPFLRTSAAKEDRVYSVVGKNESNEPYLSAHTS